MAALLIVMPFTVGLIALIVVLAMRATKTSSEGRLQPLGRALGVPDGSPFLVERHGRTFTAKYAPGGRNQPPTLRLTANVDEVAEAAPAGAYREGAREHLAVRPAIILRAETSNDRIGKRLGLNREVQTGDAAFDQAVYLETDAPEDDVRRTLAGDGIRDAVRRLLGAGVSRIQLDPTGLSAVIPGPVPLIERFDHLAALLAKIAAALPLFKTGSAAKPRSPALAIVCVIGGSLALSASIIASGRPPLDSGAKLVGLGGGFALWILITLACALLFRGRSDALRQVGLLSFAAGLAFPSATYAAVIEANRLLDTSPGVEHATTVTRTWSTTHKGSTYYHMAVTSWRPGEDAVELHPPSAFYGAASVGRPIVVTTHAGKLGWEWVDSFRWAPKP